MKNILWTASLLAFAVTSSIVTGITRHTHAEAITLSDANRKSRATAVKLGFSPPLTWETDSWTGTNEPFSRIRAELDIVSLQNKFNSSVLEDYKRKAQKNAKDPIAQFRWGYAYFKASNDGISFGTPSQNLDTLLDVAWGLQQAQSPHAYEYTRLLFLVSALRSPAYLSTVGRRLLKHTPEDYDVEFDFYRSLLSAPTVAERKEALLGAQKLIKKYPERKGAPYGVLAEVYSAQWERGDFSSGPLAVAAYEKYLSLPPKGLTPQDREGLEYWMNFIKTHPRGPKGHKIK